MTARTTPSYQSLDGEVEIPRYPLLMRARMSLIWLSIFAILAWSWAPVEMYKAVGLITDWRNMTQFASGFMEPNFSNWRQYVSEMIETVQIAFWATALAVFFAFRLQSWAPRTFVRNGWCSRCAGSWTPSGLFTKWSGRCCSSWQWD